jgi:hypothetical protein
MLEPVKYVLLALLIAASAAGGGLRAQAGTGLLINEIMASNSSSVVDPQGQYDDWIEIYNSGDKSVDVGGMYLTDDRSVPTKWRIPSDDSPATTVAAGKFLLIWADGDTADPGLHAPFELSGDGEEIALFDGDGITPIDSMTFPEQVNNISYGRFPDTGRWLFMRSPTPGRPNTAGAYEGLVAGIEFSHTRGFYGEPFDVTLTCPTPGATIRYTLDGSDPSAGTTYTGAVPVSRTTCLRACAIKSGWLPGKSNTHTYIFPSDVAAQPAYPAGFPSTWGSTTADYEMDPAITGDPRYRDLIGEALGSIPSMSIVMRMDDLFGPSGIYANPTQTGDKWERPASVEWIDPNQAAQFQINCGIRIQGAYFRGPSVSRKHSFRLLFKGQYGPTKLKYPIFGKDAVDEFDTIVLRAGANDSYAWGGNEANAQFVRDQFIRSLQRDTGNAASHGMFVHLYVNGLYWGLYNPCERPDGVFSSSYYGGDKDDWDVFKHKSLTVDQGNRTALNLMQSQCREAAESYEAFQRLQGKDLDGTFRPDYPCLLDMSNYVDYMIVNMWAGNWDWPWNNYWLARDRTAASTGFKFYCWDAEDVMLSSRSPLNIDRITSPDARDVGQFHDLLRNNPEYRLLFADRIHRLLFDGGILTPDSLIRRYTNLAAVVEKAIILEAARWADQHGSKVTPQNWTAMRDKILTTYLPQRTSIVLGQFRVAGLYPSVDVPVFYVNGAPQHGGHIMSTDSLSMRADTTVFYTLDGSDPRLPGSVAGAVEDPPWVPENAPKKVLVPTGSVDEAWRGAAEFDDSAWINGAGGVGYERSTGYEDYFSINVHGQMYNRNASCYIRIPFNVSEEQLADVTSLTLKVRYDDGFIAYLNGVEVQRALFDGTPAWNSAANASHNEDDAVNLEPFDISALLDRIKAGGNILAIQGLNYQTTSSDFLISVELVADKGDNSGLPTGASSSAIRYRGPISLDASTPIKCRALANGVWSALNEAVFAVGPVAESLRISEIMYHPADTGGPTDANAEYIELTNIGGENINLNLVELAEGVEFVFPSYDLAPGGFCLVVKDIAAFDARYGSSLPVAGEYGGSLSNAGEQIELHDAAGTVIHDFCYEDNWFDETDGMGYSLTVKDPRTADPNAFGDRSLWRASTHTGGSPGTADE